jgi:hypothetical protein
MSLGALFVDGTTIHSPTVGSEVALVGTAQLTMNRASRNYAAALEQQHRDGGEARRHGEVPAPRISFTGEEQHQDQRAAARRNRAFHVRAGGAAFGGFGHGSAMRSGGRRL